MANEELLENYSNYLRIKDYHRCYYDNIKKFLSFCEKNNIDLYNISYEDINSYMVYLKDCEFSNGYINNLLKTVRCLYRYLTESGQSDISCLQTTEKFKLLAEDKRIKDFLTKKELDELIGSAITVFRRIKPYKVKALLYFLFYTGIRRGELINLKRKDIFLQEGKAIIRAPTKNKMERYVFFPQKVSKLLRRYFYFEEEEINAFNVTIRKLKTLIKNLNTLLPKGRHLTLHMLRHSFANMLASNGISVRVAQKILGHKNMNSTLIYYDPDINIVEKIYRDNIKEEDDE